MSSVRDCRDIGQLAAARHSLRNQLTEASQRPFLQFRETTVVHPDFCLSIGYTMRASQRKSVAYSPHAAAPSELGGQARAAGDSKIHLQSTGHNHTSDFWRCPRRKNPTAVSVHTSVRLLHVSHRTFQMYKTRYRLQAHYVEHFAAV
jgi:hypothetical protein